MFDPYRVNNATSRDVMCELHFYEQRVTRGLQEALLEAQLWCSGQRPAHAVGQRDRVAVSTESGQVFIGRPTDRVGTQPAPVIGWGCPTPGRARFRSNHADRLGFAG